MKDIIDFCLFFGLQKSQVQYWICELRKPNVSAYKTLLIKKKSGGDRKLDIPPQGLKEIQRTILQRLSKEYAKQMPSCVTGFVKNRSILDNAKPHIHRRCLIKADLKDFFPTITAKRIRGLFRSLFPESGKLATVFATLVTWRDCLPQGSPCSPLLANMICLSMDKKLLAYCKRNGIHFTRYADDMTFSCTEKRLPYAFDVKANSLSPFIKRTIEESGFTINDKKTQFRPFHRRQITTGIICNTKFNLKRKFVHNLRAALHQASLDPNKARAEKKSIEGRVGFLKMVLQENHGISDEPLMLYAKYAHSFNVTFSRSFPDAEFLIDPMLGASYSVVSFTIAGVQAPDGSGFFCGDFFVTAKHVVGEGTPQTGRLVVRYLPWGETAFANYLTDVLEYEGYGEYGDVAIFHLKKNSLSPYRKLKLAANDLAHTYEIGSRVSYCGFSQKPYNGGPRWVTIYYSEARISQYHRFLDDKDIRLLLAGGQIFSGMSGGPVFNERFEVVGVVTNGINLDDCLTEAAFMFAPLNAEMMRVICQDLQWRQTHIGRGGTENSVQDAIEPPQDSGH